MPASCQNPRDADPFLLGRFVEAQSGLYAEVLEELRRGRKRTHWMWFVFPQLDGLGTSPMARRYGIKDLAEARAYLLHPVLGARLRECCEALLGLQGLTATEILGTPDDLKLRSSVTLFARVAEANSVFTRVLERYFAAVPDPRTLALLDEVSSR